MDPIGFALENFDLVGTWRDVDGKIARSTRRASWWTARSSNGPADLRQALLARSEAFVTHA